ncbi:hypothetical protein P3X46_028069 [Hevea brasiliensis]|uniref:Uncharacterized protein n=1 Tax=Hevea brasiliensis TaxID=3981 RepID=A0ABQ9KMV2_HEVBR|nr:hypothetical protein P3X46_028069 [Hevea brasiliensis]
MCTQALIDHCESHMVDEESSSRRQPNLVPSQGNPFTNNSSQASLLPALPFTPNSHNLPYNFQETNPIINASTPLILSQQPTSQPQISLFGVRNNYLIGSQQVPFPHQPLREVMMMEEPASDWTRPFLQQLEKPFSYKIELKGVDDNRNTSDLDMLDLTLKL